MSTKKRIQELVKEHLKLINKTTLAEADSELTSEQFDSFWDVIASRYIDECYQAVAGTIDVNNYAPEETWNKTWQALADLYPEYILKPARVKDTV